MSQTKVLVFVAGAALSIGAQALAQNQNLDQSRAYANELVADAGTRASLLQGAVAGGATYAGTFSTADASGNNRLNFGGTEIFRFNSSTRDESTQGNQNDWTTGFSMPVTRLRTWGNVWDKALTFKIQGDFGGTGGDQGSFELQDAWAMYTWDGGTSVKWGQFKLPVIREVNVEDEFQLAADRSVASYVFSQGYSQGIQFAYASDQFRMAGGFSDGVNTGNTDFNSPAEADYALNVRADFKAMGADWERFNDFTSWRSAPDNALMIGVAGEFQKTGNTGFTAFPATEAWLYTVDAGFEGQGWNVFAAGYGGHFKTTGGTAIDNYGGVIQAGIFVADQVELFGRWDGVFLDKDAFAKPTSIYFATGGVNYYVSPESHACKLTGQVGYAFNDTSNLFGSGGLVEGNTRNAFLGDSKKGEWSVIFQAQVVY